MSHELNLPVFVKPVVDLSLDVKRVTEVGWARRSHPEFVGVRAVKVTLELLVLSLVVILHDSEVTDWSGT